MSGAEALARSPLEQEITALARAAREASRTLARTPHDRRVAALKAAAAAIRARRGAILEANGRDVAAARERNLGPALIDRLRLDEAGIEAMAAGLEAVAALPDPLGREL